MPTNYIITPHELQMEDFRIESPSGYLFDSPIRGRIQSEDFNYVEVNPPEDLPSYAIANRQGFFLTPEPNSAIVTLFLDLPEIFFSMHDTYFIVTEVHRLRLDLIAHLFYIQVEFWWILAIANNILDPFDIPVGTTIRVPAHDVIINKWLHVPIKAYLSLENAF